MTDTQKDLLLFGGLAFLGIVLLSKLSKPAAAVGGAISSAASAVKQAVCSAECAVANAYVNATSCAPVSSELTGNVTLACGQTIPASAMKNTSFCCSTGQANFCYGGQAYTISEGSCYCQCGGGYYACYAGA